MPCTSGPGTGRAAALAKLQALQGGMRGCPLALASGVSTENVGPVLDHDAAQCFLVASSIANGFHDLNAAKVRALANRIHSTAA